MATMLPKVLEIERHQLADYARVDYAITKGEDEVAALEELCLGPNELRREASVVRDRTVLAVREVRNNMAKRAITAKNMQGSLVESLRQRSRFAVVDTVDASLRARCFASLECIPTLTLICHFIDAIKAGDFARAESVRFEFLTREDRHEYVVTSSSLRKNLETEPLFSQVRGRWFWRWIALWSLRSAVDYAATSLGMRIRL